MIAGRDDLHFDPVYTEEFVKSDNLIIDVTSIYSSEDDIIYSESKSSDDDVSDERLTPLLREWAISCSIQATHFSHLLKLLHPFYKILPLDARTILKTP